MNLIFRIKRKIHKILHPPCGEILMLHRVVAQRSQLDENRILEVMPVFLEKTILEYQSAGYRFVSLDEVRRQMKGWKFNRRKFVCFTLDDGYADNYEQAYPVFKKYNCPFAIYVTTDYADKKAQFWWYQLEDALLKNEQIKINDIEYDCSDFEKKNRAFWDIREKVFSPDAEMTLAALEQIFKENDCSVKVHALSWAQITELAADPLCTIGAHSVSHASFPLLNDVQIRKELTDGKKKIEDRIKKTVKHFSYPYGNHDSRVTGMVKEQYNTAVLTIWGEIKNGDNLFLLNRKTLVEK
jgi:peptidoglycan/xylan/chitin deacetylase (PgdA/CDA1 family)